MLQEYLQAVTKRWYPLVAAIGLDGLGLIVQATSPVDFPWWAFIATLIAGIVIAQVWAWSDLRKQLLPYRDQPTFEWGCEDVDRTIDNWYVVISVCHTGGRSASCIVQVEDFRFARTGTRPRGFAPITVKWEHRRGEQSESYEQFSLGTSRRAIVCASPLNQFHDLTNNLLAWELRPVGIRLVSSSDAVGQTTLDYPPGEYLLCLRLLGTELSHHPEREWFRVSVTEDSPSTLHIESIEPPALCTQGSPPSQAAP